MANLEDMIEEVLLNVEGYIGDQDIYGTITLPNVLTTYSKTSTLWIADTTTIIPDGTYSVNTTNGSYKRGNGVDTWVHLPYITGWVFGQGIDSTATEFLLSGPEFMTGSGFSTGLIEVGEELIYIQGIDSTTGLMYAAMRGFRGTTAVSHSVGTRARNNPRFPIIAVKRAINDTIAGMYPRIFAIKTIELKVNGFIAQYDMPANTNGILSVYYKKPGASKTWLPSKRWNFDITGASNTVTGKAVNVYDAVAGYPVQIVYTVNPVALNIGDDYSTITGLPEYSRQVATMGACWKLTSFIDSARLQNTTAEQSMHNMNRFDNNSGTNLAKYFLGVYTQLVTEAESRQRTEFMPQPHFLR